MNDEDKVVTEKMLAVLERIATAVEGMSPAASYAFMESKLPEILSQLAPLASQLKKRGKLVRVSALRKRKTARGRRRRAKKN